MHRLLLVVAALGILLAVLACMLPFLAVMKWVGHFTLTVRVATAPNVDLDSIRYADCWREDEAKWFVEQVGRFIAEFEEPIEKLGNVQQVWLTSSGSHGAFGLIDTYHHPPYVVIQYGLIGQPKGRLFRKAVPVPSGRGDRSVKVTLP
jgi:hypothetical protein